MASRLCPFCMKMTESDTCPNCGKNINYSGQPLHLPAGYVVSGRHPYVLGAALGQGGFGITYIALDMVTNERVAIKEYFPTYCSGRTEKNTVTAYQNQEDVYLKGKERFLDEARTLKSLSDLQGIVNVLDFFEANNSAYLVMEFLEGSSLKDYAAKNGCFPAQKFLQQIKPLMEDIHRMHERGVIHRDIAPDNIILQPDGQMKLIDFGAARSYLGDKSMTVVVKKGFAPVEQYMSKGSSAATDVYALAATIYYCITGTVPVDSAERQYDGTPLGSPVSLGADITPLQEKALFKALEIQQKARTQSVQEFLNDLYTAAASAPKQPEETSDQKEPSDINVTSQNSGLESRRNKEKRAKRFSSRKSITGAVICILLLGIALFAITANSRKYNRACKYLTQEQFSEASRLFAQLEDYKDSQHKWEQATYGRAEDFVADEQFNEALRLLQEIPDYNKSDDLANEIHYQKGTLYLNEKQYSDAYIELSLIPTHYKSAMNLLHRVRTEWGENIIQTSDLTAAKDFVRNVKLTEQESDHLYNCIIQKDYYFADGSTSNHIDLQTRKCMLDALVGQYPLKESLSKLFDKFSAAKAETFIRENYDLISGLWDVPVMQNILQENWNLCIWLLGKWKANNGYYIEFYEKENDSSIWTYHTLPWVEKPAGTEHWDIVDMEYMWVDKTFRELAKVYRFEFLGPDSMNVYCYKNHTTYLVTRSR